MSEWRDELLQRRRAVILDAAAEIFAAKGYSRATIKEIAERAGIAPGTIYLYFTNKRELLLSIAEQLVNVLPSDLELLEKDMPETVLVQRLLDKALLMIYHNWSFIRVLAAEMWTDEELRREYLTQVLGPMVAAFEARLRVHVAAGEIRDLDVSVAARAMIGAVIAFMIASDVSPDSIEDPLYREKLVRDLSRFFLYGLRGKAAEACE